MLTILVLSGVAVATAMVRAVLLRAATTTLLATRSTASVSVLDFGSSKYDPKWLIKIAQNTDFERYSQVCILLYELSLYLVIFLLTGAF